MVVNQRVSFNEQVHFTYNYVVKTEENNIPRHDICNSLYGINCHNTDFIKWHSFLSDKLLVVVDQHAAHERVRLEDLIQST